MELNAVTWYSYNTEQKNPASGLDSLPRWEFSIRTIKYTQNVCFVCTVLRILTVQKGINQVWFRRLSDNYPIVDLYYLLGSRCYGWGFLFPNFTWDWPWPPPLPHTSSPLSGPAADGTEMHDRKAGFLPPLLQLHRLHDDCKSIFSHRDCRMFKHRAVL